MTKCLIVMFLLSYYDVPNRNEYPPKEVGAVIRRLTENQWNGVVSMSAASGVHFPGAEITMWGTNDMNQEAAYNVFWRRAQGRPFPYPTDKILGTIP